MIKRIAPSLILLVMPFIGSAGGPRTPVEDVLFRGVDYWSRFVPPTQLQQPTLCLDIEELAIEDIRKQAAPSLTREQIGGFYALLTEENCYKPRMFQTVLQHYRQYMSAEAVEFVDSMGYAAVFLSGLVPDIKSDHDRAGWWQLSFPVAVKYGLVVNEEVDERLDPVKATEAATRYYRDMQKNLWDPGIALLSFIESPTLIERSRRRYQGEDGPLPERFRKTLKELRILRKAMSKSEARKEDLLHLDSLIQPVTFTTPIYVAGVRMGNPQLLSDIITSSTSKRIVVWGYSEELDKYRAVSDSLKQFAKRSMAVQAKKIEERRENIKKGIPDPRKYRTSEYQVRPGDNLGAIAGRFKVRVSDLRDWNDLRGDLIRVGQTLMIFTPLGTEPVEVKQPIREEPREPVKFNREYTEYTVKEGDTLWKIAREFPGVSAENIMEYNRIDEEIQVGQVLRIPKLP
ncbi:MAG: LysM peptidoglycan-binding domain-containing protein [Bacteroidota bacterium]|nr:LysM peptidoglycan-binding domain-containing protein [Bacteroidota bacterium]MDX5449289.1 LysM peptidoglycan-binding domain-containing protein [Bacteroidota bacterium]MDX5505071.1 LysM peptidoglycan-binding domain-containing protein [Bacteroidota bacterium]